MMFFSLAGLIAIIFVINKDMKGCHWFFIFIADMFIVIVFVIDYFELATQSFCK